MTNREVLLSELVAGWIAEHVHRFEQHKDTYSANPRYYLRSVLPKRPLVKLARLLSAIQLETIFKPDQTTKQVDESFIEKCYERLFNFRFETVEPSINIKLRTKQEQLLTATSCEFNSQLNPPSFKSLYFENHIQQCFLSVIQVQQENYFRNIEGESILSMNISQQVAQDIGKAFNDDGIVIYISNLSKQALKLRTQLETYGSLIKRLNISKSLLRFVSDSELSILCACFNNVDSVLFRDLRPSDLDKVLEVLHHFKNNLLRSVSFYHSFFSEDSMNAIIRKLSLDMVQESIDYSIYFNRDIVVQKSSEQRLMDDDDDDLDLYSDLFTEETTQDKKRHFEYSEEHTIGKRLKTQTSSLEHLAFKSVSLNASSCSLLGTLLSHNNYPSISLSFSFNEMSSTMAASMLDGLSYESTTSSLTSLQLTENNMENDFLVYLSLKHRLLGQLKYLDLSNNNFVGMSGLNVLFETLSRQSLPLEHINLSKNKFGGTDLLNDTYHNENQHNLEPLIHFISTKTNVRVLLLNDCDLLPSMVEQIMLAISHNENITTLDISHNHSIGTENALALMIHNNKTLQSLALSCCSLSEINHTLQKALTNNATLKYIDLSGNRLQDRGGLAIVSIIRQKLERFNSAKVRNEMAIDLSTNRFTEQVCLEMIRLFKEYEGDNYFTLSTLLLENNFFSQSSTLQLRVASLESGVVSKIVLTNEDGKAQLYFHPCDGTTVT